MKFTLSWLKDHLDTEASLAEICDWLTMLGLEVENVHDPSADFAAFRCARVVEAKPHPDADRLQICMVDTGSEKVQVVCGAPNARTGLKGVFAPAGSRVPGTGLRLKKSKIRGVESNGMLLSERELGLSEDHEGIVELPEDAETGTPAAALLGLAAPVIELAITPNRGDCLGVRGVARDLAAAGLGVLKPFEPPGITAKFDTPVVWNRDFPDGAGDACPMVVGRAFRGVKNGPSPKWLQDRLTAIGLRPISALVDITNYITFDLGRPLHVFDMAKIKGDLTMRFAREGEAIDALDGRSYVLGDGMTVIADDVGPQAIGGIMGGAASGCTGATTDVFLEVALFDPVRTAATGRRLGIESDARYRFERGVDPESALWGAAAASAKILELCGGEASSLTVAGETPASDRTATLRTGRLATFGGADIPPGEARTILGRLGFETSLAEGVVTARIPSWRPDVEGEHCLVEEVLRVWGYDRIPAVPLERETALPAPALTPVQRRIAFARRALAGRGMMEAVTWSFTGKATAALFAETADSLVLANPISADLDVMRPSALANLLAAAQRNADRGYPDIALFEVGAVWRDDTPEGQDTVAAALRHGQTGPRHWAKAPRAVDAFDAKADAIAVLAQCGAPVDNLQVTRNAPDYYHPGRSGALRLGPNVLAWFGEIHPRVLRRLGAAAPAAAAEVFVDRIPRPRGRVARTRPAFEAPPFQPVTRDFAFVVDADVEAAALQRAARNADRMLIVDVGVFDLFEGPALGEGRKSVAISVTLQPVDHTLAEAEIEAVSAKIVAHVGKQTGATLRS